MGIRTGSTKGMWFLVRGNTYHTMGEELKRQEDKTCYAEKQWRNEDMGPRHMQEGKNE